MATALDSVGNETHKKYPPVHGHKAAVVPSSRAPKVLLKAVARSASNWRPFSMRRMSSPVSAAPATAAAASVGTGEPPDVAKGTSASRSRTQEHTQWIQP